MSTSNITSLQNKLKGEWTAHNALLSLNLLSEIESSYEQLEKHTKLRILISFLLLDDGKRNQHSKHISAICLKATKETDMWIKVTSDMVVKRLGISSEDSPILKQLASRCLEKFNGLDQFEYSPYFPPLEFKYLDPCLLPAFASHPPMNRHFTSTMDMPKLIPIDFDEEGGGVEDAARVDSRYMLALTLVL